MKSKERQKFCDLSASEQAECAGKLVKAAKQIGNQHRLLLLAELEGSDYSVHDLQVILHRSQPSVSNDLAVLRALDLVHSDHVGNRSINRLNKQVRGKIKALLETLLELETDLEAGR